MNHCRDTLRAAGHGFSFTIHPGDFILDGPRGPSSTPSLFESSDSYDAVIMNPPYFKVGTGSAHARAMAQAQLQTARAQQAAAEAERQRVEEAADRERRAEIEAERQRRMEAEAEVRAYAQQQRQLDYDAEIARRRAYEEAQRRYYEPGPPPYAPAWGYRRY